MLQHLLNNPAACVVENHEDGQGELEFVAEGNQAQFLVDFGDELRGAGEGDAGCGDETPVHGLVFADGLAEGTALVVDGEGRDLLDELQEVDGAIEEGWFEFAFEVDVV